MGARLRRREFDREGGQALVITIFCLFAIFACAALAIDMSRIWVARHQAQVAADAGALAAAQAMETTTVGSTITTAGSTLAGANDGGGTSTISQLTNSGGNEAEAQVNNRVNLLFGNVLGVGSDGVGASAVAQVQSNTTQVVDGNISPAGCGNGTDDFCEYYATSSCNGNSQYSWAFSGPTIGTGPWSIYTGYNDSTNTFECSSVNLQDCNGAVGGGCIDQNGNPITNEVVDLNGDSVGGMYQTVATTAGAQYELSFLLTGNPAGESCVYDTFTGYVQINENDVNGPLLAAQDFSHTNQCASDTETATFQVVTVPFVAKSSSTTLIFQSTTCTGQNGYTGDTCPTSPRNYWYYGPEVTNVELTYPSIALVQ